VLIDAVLAPVEIEDSRRVLDAIIATLVMSRGSNLAV